MVLFGRSDKGEVEDLTKEFIAESQEGLDQMERCLTTLEVRPDDPELLGEIFRAVHTIKGTTGFLGFERLERLAHAGETLLGLLRDGRLRVTDDLVSGLLDLLDGLRRILRLIDETGGEGKREGDEDLGLIERLGALADAAEFAAVVEASSIPAVGRDTRARVEAVEAVAAAVGGALVEGEKVTYSGGASGAGNERTLRVEVEVLNRMMNLVGELVLTRNQILQSSLDTQEFAQLGRRLNAVTADLRETVMQARMQPVGHVFSKFPRLVRDLAKTCGKRVRIEFAGQETGLDKSLLEAIKDPLTHAVRNAVDHGIEGPETRALAGKGLEGVLQLRAFHQGGSVVIELSDDGAGIAVERVRAKAVERKLVTRERALAMTDGDVAQMVFLPGFSTAEAVTNISGRGVGMDVVRSNIEKVGGSVELTSRAGRGTTLRLRVPLTLAIIPALVVVSGGQSFALPQSALVELVYVGADEVRGVVERVGKAELYRLREQLLPMVRLDRLLGIETSDLRTETAFYLAVLEVDGCRFGLVLDDLLAPEEIVVKPLSLVLREIGIFSGATVLGNGTLALILDVPATAARAQVSGIAEEASKRPSARTAMEVVGQRFLMFDAGGSASRGEQLAIALDQVERIESVAVESIEYAGGSLRLQYRGEAIGMEDPEEVVAGVSASGGEQVVTVLICKNERRRVRTGLVVREVYQVAMGTMLPGDTGMALVEGRLATVREMWKERSELVGTDRAMAFGEGA